MDRSLTIASGHRREGRERDYSDLRRQLVEEEDGRDLQFLISDANSPRVNMVAISDLRRQLVEDEDVGHILISNSSSQDYQAYRVARSNHITNF